MIDPDTRNAIYQLHLAGTSLRMISRQFKISRNTVRAIIQQQGAMPQTVRKDKIQVDPELLKRLYQECAGWIQRIHEKLAEEENIQVSYPTLTRLLREMGLGKSRKVRCDRVPDEPGMEMQHDTTVYQIKLAGQRTKVVASLLYLRYSKRKYLKFYRVFNRFTMKCFLHEALMYWSYSAPRCIIDNTNLARLRGTGKRAVIVPEMATFAQRYHFEFRCHELMHANRKAGNERSFWTTETNFLPGRKFESFEDLNQQAFSWATDRLYHRPIAKTGLIPAKAFEHERGYLTELSPSLVAPYLTHERNTDQYGYAAFAGNYYWIPGNQRQTVKLLQYADRVKIYQHRACVADYPLPPDGVKNERFSPPGQPVPRHEPRHRVRDSSEEEKRLRALGNDVDAYLDYALEASFIQRHRFLRKLFTLSRRVPRNIFLQAMQRALRYRITHLDSLQRIIWFCISQGEVYLPEAEVDESYLDRPAYLEGCLTDEPDLSIYDDDPELPNEDEQEGQENG